MRRALPLLLLLATLPAHAQSRHLEAAGRALSIDGPCAKSVRITPDASLSGHAVLDATAQHEPELAQLAFATENDQARLHITGQSCWRDSSDFAPTLAIALRIPPNFPVNVEDGGSPEYSIGDTHAPLSINASGDMQLTAGQVGVLALELSGAGKIEIAGVRDAAHVELSGSGSASIGGGEIRALNVEASGSGRLHYGTGTISALHLEDSGSADVQIDATVGAAAVELSGSGNARVARITGPVAQEISGSGKLEVLSR